MQAVRPHPGALRRRRAGALLGVLTLLATLLPWATPPARSETTPAVSVTITAITPAAGRDDVVTIRGTVRNTSKLKLFGSQVVFWRSFDPLTTQDELGAAARRADADYGATHVAKDENISRITPFDQPEMSFDPGDEASFSVRAHMDELGFPRTDAAYVVGVRVHAHEQDGPWRTVGSARTFLPALSTKTKAPVATVIVLSSTPAMYADGLFSDDHLADELAGRLLTSNPAPPPPSTTHPTHPTPNAEAPGMGEAYRVGPPGHPREGAGRAPATTWLNALAEAAGDGYVLPFANVDLQALGSTGQTAGVAKRTRAATRSVEALEHLPLAVLPRHGLLDAKGLALAAELDPTLVLASTVRPPATLTKLTDRPAVVRFSADAFAGGPPGATTGPAHGRQRLRAEALVARAQKSAAVRLVTNEAELALAEATNDRWTSPVTLREVLGQQPQPTATLGTVDRAQGLTDAQLESGAELSRALGIYQSLTTADLDVTSAVLVSRATSQAWRDQPELGAQFVAAALQRWDVRDSKAVSISAAKRFVMSSRDNEFPVTVTNELSVPVTVQLTFTSRMPTRLTIPTYRDITVPPGETLTVNVRPEAQSNGVVPVRAQLRTPGGSPIGSPTTIEVLATSLGAVAWAIVIVSGLVLVGATALRIRQVRRRNAERPEPTRPADHIAQPGLDEPALGDDDSREQNHRPVERKATS